ncbi:MAG: FG-GAP repeat domain-containing protein [Acutalibacteraceae bacterium]
MLLRKFLCVFYTLAILISLCGCDIFTVDTAELLSPPPLPADMRPIDEAIKKSAAKGYKLQYPSRGDYRSAIVQQDIDNDGILEVFAFYSTQGEESTVMHINAIVYNRGEWHSVAKQQIVAGGVDKLDFCDLDGDGIQEILVGWEIYGSSELQLAVYSLSKNTLTQRMLQQYTHFVPCDLDEDNHNEIFIVKSLPSQALNTASLYTITNAGVAETGSCELDSTVKTINEPKYSTLSNGKPAMYIDEIKGVGAVTEVIFLEKGRLVNPLRSTDSRETVRTLRSAAFETKDINDDGILEIPIQTDVPMVARSEIREKIYLTNWCSFNGEALTNQLTAAMNTSDRYYYVIPKKWVDRIAILKDPESSLMEIYRYNPDTLAAEERLMFIKAVKKSEWDAGKYKNRDLIEIVNDGETSYICHISEAAINDGVDYNKVKADFKLF